MSIKWDGIYKVVAQHCSQGQDSINTSYIIIIILSFIIIYVIS